MQHRLLAPTGIVPSCRPVSACVHIVHSFSSLHTRSSVSMRFTFSFSPPAPVVAPPDSDSADHHNTRSMALWQHFLLLPYCGRARKKGAPSPDDDYVGTSPIQHMQQQLDLARMTTTGKHFLPFSVRT